MIVKLFYVTERCQHILINALAKAGFVVEQLVEESDHKSLNATGDVDPKTKKAKMLPISFCIKARKL